MKNSIQHWLAIALIATIAISCADDPLREHVNKQRVVLEFETTSTTVPENSTFALVTVKFNKPLASDGILKVRVDDKFNNHLTADPSVEDNNISVAVRRGERTATFKVKPINNERRDGSRTTSIRIHSLTGLFVLGTKNVLAITILDDESALPTESLANFVQQTVTLDETNTSGVEYQVHFSEAVSVDSEVKLTLTSERGTYGRDYISVPAAESDTITLQVGAGLRVISFTLRPVNNDRITGELKVQLVIARTSGSIRKGNKLQETLTIKDDELAGKPRGYEVTAGSTVLKRFLEYDEQGRVSKVHIETYNPYHTATTQSYVYDANNNLVKIERSPGREILYHWQNGRITRSESFQSGVLREYHEYGYDDAGNLGAVKSFYKQPDGSFADGGTTIYLYFTDGNLYKSLSYIDSGDPENPTLISTRTYDNYIAAENPFPMTEVLPNIKMQRDLPTTYRVEESGYELVYHMSYEFRPDGLPEKRIATSANDTQTAVYHYY